MPEESDRIKILKEAISTMSSFYGHVTNIYDQLRLKALAVLAGEVALVTFMFSGDGIPVPREPYGAVFFYVGFLFLSAAFGLLLWTISPLEWKIPYDQISSKDLSKYKTYASFLEYLNDDYIEATQHCIKPVSKKAKRFTWTIYLLAAGAIILMVIRFGGGQE